MTRLVQCDKCGVIEGDLEKKHIRHVIGPDHVIKDLCVEPCDREFNEFNQMLKHRGLGTAAKVEHLLAWFK